MKSCYHCGAWFTGERPLAEGICVACDRKDDLRWGRDRNGDGFSMAEFLRLKVALKHHHYEHAA
jgi:hypothetical protein